MANMEKALPERGNALGQGELKKLLEISEKWLNEL
jgi:hypothetical protein